MHKNLTVTILILKDYFKIYYGRYAGVFISTVVDNYNNTFRTFIIQIINNAVVFKIPCVTIVHLGLEYLVLGLSQTIVY